MALGHEQLLDASQFFWKPRLLCPNPAVKRGSCFTGTSGGTPNATAVELNEKVSLLAILGDFFGMVK